MTLKTLVPTAIFPVKMLQTSIHFKNLKNKAPNQKLTDQTKEHMRKTF